jgi:hypothetical protein
MSDRKIVYGGLAESEGEAHRSVARTLSFVENQPITGSWLEEPHVVGEVDGLWRWEGVWSLGWYSRERLTREMPALVMAQRVERVHGT